MRLAVRLWLVVAVATGGWGGPVPVPSSEENLVEVHEEGLLVLVPSLPADEAEEGKNGQDLKREVGGAEQLVAPLSFLPFLYLPRLVCLNVI